MPIAVSENFSCNISRHTQLPDLIRQADVLIWDEAPMSHVHVLNALDRSPRDIREVDLPDGGLPTIFGGDFQQTAPVVPFASRQDIVDATMHNAVIWQHVQVLSLTENMRLRDSTPDNKKFAEWLGRLSFNPSCTPFSTLPDVIYATSNLEESASRVYLNMLSEHKNRGYFEKRAIVTPSNETVRELSNYFLDRFPGWLIIRHADGR